MSRTTPPPRWSSRRLFRAGAALAGTALVATAVAAGPAQSATHPPCPAPTGAGKVHAGDRVTGLTVSSGTTPTGFNGTILGVLTGGVAPGIPMILARLGSPEIDRVGGIWQGMSGSPVYASDGTLVGAVAYGLSVGPSPVAGITPAEDMEALVGAGSVSGAKASPKVPLPQRLQDAVVGSGAASPAEAGSGLSQLDTPFTLTALGGSARVARLTPHLRLGGNVRVVGAGAASTSGASGTGTASAIVPGGSMAASISYGDVTAAGVGTTTAVCSGKVVAFGHPFLLSGPARMSLHTAAPIYVQEDPTIAPFVVANIGGRVGRILQDRVVGIAGRLGRAPAPVPVVSTVHGARKTRTGTTYVTATDLLTDLASTHVLTDTVVAMGGSGKGSGMFRYQISGLRGNGRPFTLTRADPVADEYDVGFLTSSTLFDALSQLQYNGEENLTFTKVTTTSTLSTTYGVYRVAGIERRVGGRWTSVTPSMPATVRAGRVVHIRVRLVSKDIATRYLPVDLRIPAGAAGSSGYVSALGGNSAAPTGPGSGNRVDQILHQLRDAPRRDVVTTSFRLTGRGGKVIASRVAVSATGKVVNDRTQILVRVVK